MSEVQIDVNTILDAFSKEIASLSQRAIIAEQKAAAFEQANNTAQKRAQALQAQLDALAPEVTLPPDVVPGEVAAPDES